MLLRFAAYSLYGAALILWLLTWPFLWLNLRAASVLNPFAE